MCQEGLNVLSLAWKGLRSLPYLGRDPLPSFPLSQLGGLTWHLRSEPRQKKKQPLSFLFGPKSQTEVMSASPWCVWVKNQMLKFESLEELHLAEGTWRLWSFLLIWEWVVWSALFCFLVPMGACVLARLRAAKSASTHQMEKNTYWPLQILLLSEVLLLSHKLLRNGFRWRKAHFHLRVQCDWWLIWTCKKNPGYSWLLSCWACSTGLISLAWCGFHALSLWCVENFRNCCVRSVCLVPFCCWSF